MNSASPISLQKTENNIENNMLSSSGGLSPEHENDLSSSEFSELLGDTMTASGKVRPLSESQDLGIIDLPAEFSNPEHLSVLHNLALKTDGQIDNVELFGHPVANQALKSTLFNGDALDQDIFNNKNSINEKLFASKTATATDIQPLTLKQEANALLSSDEMDLSQFIKSINKNNSESGSEFQTYPGRQETNSTKLTEQFISIDKQINSATALNNHTLKSYSGFDQAGTSLNRIEVPVNQTAWGETLGNRLMMMINGRMQSANIHLNPAELGPIEIRVSVNQEQASVQFVSNNSLVREAIEDAFPRLKEMFTQNGLNLAGANVSQQSSQQESHFSNEEKESMLLDKQIDTANTKEDETNHSLVNIGLVDQYV